MLDFYLWIKPGHQRNGSLHLTGFHSPGRLIFTEIINADLVFCCEEAFNLL